MKRHLPIVLALISSAGCSASGSKPPSEPAAETEGPSAQPATSGTSAAADVLPCIDDDEAGCTAKCDSGDLESCVRLARIYSFGNANVRTNLPKARALADRACTGGLGKGCYSLATAYELGSGVSKDPQKAQQLTTKAIPLLIAACEGADAESCSILADMHLSGQGMLKDSAKEADLRRRATDLYGRSCEAGDASACFMFGGDMLTAKKFELAARVLEKGCNLGDAGSCSLLGGCYDEGVGVKADPAKAKALWAKACKGGNVASCSR
ncbi:MAG: sel1 repeat family protein [Polyangiaceae bacterium]|nr:sel1 repeat family protein [Polyangiaceae bacterium]